MEREQSILEMALEVGFDMAGIAPLSPPPASDRFRTWLEAGHHGSMTWLERNRDRITDPARVLEGGRSILVLGLGHARASVKLAGGGRVARYAAGRDYHNKVGTLLRRLARRLAESGLIRGGHRSIVDAGPLLERSHAAVAGLGAESKAANLLHRHHGPWFFLAELLLEEDLVPTEPSSIPSCGSCTACIDACPTTAIIEPGVVDARRCISYQTIENRGAVPEELRAQLGGWVFGCDICSEVCPWGNKAPDREESLGTHQVVAEGNLVDWLRSGESLAERLTGSPLNRPRRAGLARNAALALAHAPSENGRDALLWAMESDPSALVREAAAWSLRTAHNRDAGVPEALDRAKRGGSIPAATT